MTTHCQEINTVWVCFKKRLALSHTDDVATYGFNKQDLDLQLHK